MYEKLYSKGVEYLEGKDYIKAIELLSKASVYAEVNNKTDIFELSTKDIGRAYLNLFRYTEAYDIFSNLVETSGNIEIKEYSLSRLALISVETGDYKTALNIFDILPPSERNVINNALTYYHLSHYEKMREYSERGLKLLDTLNIDPTHQTRLARVSNIRGMLYQEKECYFEAEEHFRKAIKISEDCDTKARNMIDLAGLYIEKKEYNKAIAVLDNAKAITYKSNFLGIAYDFKLRGIIAKKQERFEDACDYLLKAAELLNEKGLFKDLKEVMCYLADMKKCGSYESQKYLAEGLNFEKRQEEVMKRNEKIHYLLDASFFCS